ncbi:T9SS type A sorting domain-containing protein [bacterium]|nr:T9SS type A sorting domain-containing protein [bacterium]
MVNKIFGLILLLICSANLEAATVNLQPAVVPVELNQWFAVDIMVNDVTDLMGAEIHIGFDPARLESGTMSKGELLERDSCDSVFFLPATSTGKVWFAVSRLGGNPTGVAGSGTIATINFKCIASGTISLLSIDLTDLRNASLQTIPVTGTSGTSVTIGQGTATTLAIEPAWGTVTSGGTITYTATAKDNAGNTWTVTTDTVFSSDDPNGTFTGSIYTAGMIGTATIIGVYNSLPGTATVVVTTQGTATGLTIEPATQTAASGAIIIYTAEARDNAGNTWTVTADTVFSSDDPVGTFTGSIYTAGRVGIWTITGTCTGSVVGTAMVVVVTHGTATGLTIEPATQTVALGATIIYTAIARDNAGNTWTVTAGTVFGSDDPGGTFTAGNKYKAGSGGTWTITGTYADSVVGTATVVVAYGTATTLTIEPACGTTTSGNTITYTATAKDNAGNTWTVTADTVFSSDDPGGTFTAGSKYKADRVGTWTITGTYAGSVVGTATVVVAYGTAATLTIEPAWSMVASGDTVYYAAIARDNAGNTWTVTTNTVFSSDDTEGTFTAGSNKYKAGSGGTWTITGTYAGSVVGTATVVVVEYGTATMLTIEPAWDTVAFGGTVDYAAIAQNNAGNTWTVTNGTVFSSNDPSGTFTEGSKYKAGSVGTWTITGEYAGSVVGTATVVVLAHGTATALTIELATQTVASGGTITYIATARDATGNTWTVTADTVFSSNDTGGTFTDSIYTAGMVGTWTITGIYADSVVGTATVVVEYGTATTLTIEPAWGTITSGGTITYTATAKDNAGNTWTVAAVFSSDDTLGTCTGNTYTAGGVGTWMITGEYADLLDYATVIVLTELPVGISINPSPISDQICHKPFELTITTVDRQDTQIAYSGTLTLSDLTGSITPQVVQIVNGAWTGSISIDKSMLNDRLTLEIAVIKKTSNSFDVLMDNASEEKIDDEGIALVVKAWSMNEDYCLQINHPDPDSYEIDQAKIQSGTASILSDTLCEIKGTTATGVSISSFNQPVTLSLIYQPEDLSNSNIDVKTLQICRLQNEHWVPVHGNVYPDNNMVTAPINKPGIFILRGVPFGKSPSDVIVYPNPCKGTEMIFRGLPDDYTIEIYDLAGDLVKRIQGQKAEYTWDTCDDSGRLLDSGVYIYAIIGKKESKSGKVVIIR